MNIFEIMKAQCRMARPHEIVVLIEYKDGSREAKTISGAEWTKLPKENLMRVEINGVEAWIERRNQNGAIPQNRTIPDYWK